MIAATLFCCNSHALLLTRKILLSYTVSRTVWAKAVVAMMGHVRDDEAGSHVLWSAVYVFTLILQRL